MINRAIPHNIPRFEMNDKIKIPTHENTMGRVCIVFKDFALYKIKPIINTESDKLKINKVLDERGLSNKSGAALIMFTIKMIKKMKA